MPPAVKCQRPAVKTRLAPSEQSTEKSIARFARVSKGLGNRGSRKAVDSATTPVKDAMVAASTPSSRKRKAAATTQDDPDSSADEASKATPNVSKEQNKQKETLSAKRSRGRPPKKLRPAAVSLKRRRSPSVSDSDESGLNSDELFKRLRIESSPSRASSPLTADTSIAGSEVGADFEVLSVPTLPTELVHLADLHAAFLRALTLHLAHNGSHVPADLRALCPNVARAWGKKAVSEADIRICLGVLSWGDEKPVFSLSDYGRGKICVEIDHAQSPGPLNEKKLNSIFHSNIHALWQQRMPTALTSNINGFISNLPKASITLCDSVTKASIVVAKGQQRLAELKQGMAAKRLEKNMKAAASSASAQSPVTNASGSKMSLLDRIRFKQMQKASLPAGASPAEIERRAALQRVDEVSSLIGMLSRASTGGMGRVSFPMPVMLQKLKDSFRMGISKEEGATCVRLIAKEVAPEWVTVVTINGKENVVVETDRELSKAEVARRLQGIVEKL